jgi:hypothetical protein
MSRHTVKEMEGRDELQEMHDLATEGASFYEAEPKPIAWQVLVGTLIAGPILVIGLLSLLTAVVGGIEEALLALLGGGNG